MTSKEAKLKFFGLITTAAKQDEQLDYSAVSQMLETPDTTLKRWANEFKKKADEDSTLKLINVDEVMINRIAEELEAEAEELDGPRTRVNPVTGEIELVKNDVVATQRKESIGKFRDSVNGLQLLNNEVQATAGTLVHKIMDAADEEELSTRDLVGLTKALTDIQNAFFNKPTTNVQVNNIQSDGESDSLLKAFKERLKP